MRFRKKAGRSSEGGGKVYSLADARARRAMKRDPRLAHADGLRQKAERAGERAAEAYERLVKTTSGDLSAADPRIARVRHEIGAASLAWIETSQAYAALGQERLAEQSLNYSHEWVKVGKLLTGSARSGERMKRLRTGNARATHAKQKSKKAGAKRWSRPKYSALPGGPRAAGSSHFDQGKDYASQARYWERAAKEETRPTLRKEYRQKARVLRNRARRHLERAKRFRGVYSRSGER